MPTAILKCSCSHPYQDSKYGIGNRVHNLKKINPAHQQYVCTVCAREKEK